MQGVEEAKTERDSAVDPESVEILNQMYIDKVNDINARHIDARSKVTILERLRSTPLPSPSPP